MPTPPEKRLRASWPAGIALVVLATMASVSARAADEPPPVSNGLLPIGADWAVKRGIDLPNPFGVSLFAITMTRDIEVTDVRVGLPGGEPVTVGDLATFAVRNSTTIAAVKLDAWVLPLLNVYVLAGHTWTDSRLNLAVKIDRPLGDPVVLEATQDAAVGGPLLGGGASLVAGHGPWFVLVDANYNYSDVEGFEGGIGAWFASARTGWSGPTRSGTWRAWLGAAWLRTDRTIRITQESPGLGTVVVEVDQRPVDPLTWQTGGSLGLGKRWEVMLEVGSNFDDAFMGVFSASYRF